MLKLEVKHQLMNYYVINMNLIFYNNQLLVLDNIDGIYELPAISDLILLNIHEYKITNPNISCLALITNEILPARFKLIGFRQILLSFSESVAHIIIYYQQLLHYFLQHKYCGICGNATKILATNVVHCDHCNNEIYPRISPAMMVRIRRNDEILLARGMNFAPNIWGLVAGYVDIGESIEDTIHREVMEEVGLKVTNLKYWGSQYWPMPNSLMIGFTADYLSGELNIDHVEIADAGFFRKDNMPGKPSTSYSLASRMIDDF